MLVVSVGMGKKIANLNPGVYYSKNNGASWTKANYRLGQPGRIMAMRPDLRDENVVWVALYGTGWMKGIISNSSVRAVASNLYLHSAETSQLDGRGSVGTNLSYLWSGPSTNPTLSSKTLAAPTFTTPVVAAGVTREFKYNLTVTDGVSKASDVMEVRVIARGY
eukprot:m.36704 g.36704  ORF g.36704 m.36704 type:complete len:164 (+) comp17431_c0_seq1:93-584(+)